MKNSTTLRQKFVAQALEEIRGKYKKEYICQHLDDIILAAPSHGIVQKMLADMEAALTKENLVITPEKIQIKPH